MDPISHGVIGGAIFALFKEPALDNPAFIGAVIGAIAPDFDIITKLKGDYVYLKHHRVESHSIVGIIPIAATITLGLSVVFADALLREVFLWSVIGVLSHIFFDYMNSYGVAFLYPLTRKKLSLNLITIYDPVILLLCGYILMFYKGLFYEFSSIILIFVVYLFIKYRDRNKLSAIILKQNDIMRSDIKITLMPAEYNPFSWNFLLKEKDKWIIGDICSFKRSPSKLQTLERVYHPMIEKSLKEELGLYFSDFTPYFHAVVTKEKNFISVRLTDLRYRIKNGFKHHAIINYNGKAQLISSFFHPFRLDNRIPIKPQK